MSFQSVPLQDKLPDDAMGRTSVALVARTDAMTDSLATVIIPNYNGRRFLPRLMGSLAGQSEQRFATLVVDDASPQDDIAYLQANWPQVRVIRNEKNLGFAATCNVGLRAAETAFVVLLNNDTHVDRDWLSEGLRPFADARVAAVASLTLLADSPHLVDTAGDLYTVAGGALKRGHLGPREAAEQLPEDIFSPSGVSAFYRREAVLKAGGLDEEFESYYEDVDLGFRLAAMGYRSVFAPQSICYHHLSASYSPRGRRYHRNSSRNAEIVWWANLPRALCWRYLPVHLAFLFMQGGHKMMQGVGLAWLEGKLAFLGHLSHVARKRRQMKNLARISSAELARRLRRDWWSLHLGSRRSAAGASSNEVGAQDV